MPARIAFLIALVAIALVACDKPKEKAKSESPDAGAKAEGDSGKAAAAATTDDELSKLPFHATGPVAKVGSAEVSAASFNEEVTRMHKMVPVLPPGQAENYKNKVIDNLVSKMLLEQAVAADGITVSDADVNAEFEKVKKRVEATSPLGMAAFYQRSGIDEAAFKTELKDSVKFKALVKKRKGIAIDDAKAKAHYEADPQGQFGAQVKASHILLKMDPKADAKTKKEVKKKAKGILKDAKKKDADFAALAKTHSEGPSGPRGGDLGFFTKKKMVPPFAEAAWKLKPGQVSGLVETQFGIHIIKVFERKEAPKFEEAKADIVDTLEAQELRTATGQVLEELKAAAKVEKLMTNIKDNPNAAAPPAAPPGMGGIPGMQGGGGHPNLNQLKLQQNLKMQNNLKLKPPTPAPAPTPAPTGK